MSGNVLLVGPTSAIGRALAKELATASCAMHLGGRNLVKTQRIAADLSIRFQIPVSFSRFDASAPETHASLITDMQEQMGEPDVAVISIGEMGDQGNARSDLDHFKRIVDSNYLGVACLLALLADGMEQSKSGRIAVISSVAGDRGRQSNYPYGSAKAGLNAYLAGLRQRLAPNGVHVLTVKPGFVDTPMTFGKPGTFLVASPEIVARRIAQAIEKREDILYVPWFWRWIMLIIKLIPEPVFKRLRL